MADESLRTTIAVQVDPVCQKFEAAWRRGDRPKIEEFVASADMGDGEVLGFELLRIEVAYRLETGEHPTREEYRSRLPRQRGQIDDILLIHYGDEQFGAMLELVAEP